MLHAPKITCSIGALLIAAALSGCFSTHLPPLDEPPALSRLTSLAEGDIAFTLDASGLEGSRGHQYLSLLPFTRVYTPDLATEVTNQLKVQAGLKGYRLVPDEGQRGRRYHLAVKVEECAVSGYCYVLLRRPHSRIVLAATLKDASGQVIRRCEGAGKSTFTAKFAFSDELNEARRLALTDASVALFDCLELPKAAARDH